MKIVFFGSAEFAVPSLKALLDEGYPVSCVVTQPDRKKGRGLHTQPTPIKLLAQKQGLEIYQPQNFNLPAALNFLKEQGADLFVVIAYGHILSKEVLASAKLFSLNVHASLLPKYRGAAPINWALIKGERASGVTVIKMSEIMDAGQIIDQEKIEIDQKDNALVLEEKLAHLAASLLIKSIRAIENKSYQLVQQDTAAVSFAPKLKKQDGLIRWEKPAVEIYDLIRGCLGWPGAFTYYQGKLLKIYVAKVTGLPGHQVTGPGEIAEVSKEGLLVATGKDFLRINELQLEGKRRMSSEEFIAGHKINTGVKLG